MIELLTRVAAAVIDEVDPRLFRIRGFGVIERRRDEACEVAARRHVVQLRDLRIRTAFAIRDRLLLGSQLAVARESVASRPSLRYERPRTLFREECVLHIRDRLIAHKPKLVVFYRSVRDQMVAWNEIAGRALERDLPVMVGESQCLVTYIRLENGLGAIGYE